MVKSISDALGEPDLYTNALVNEYLPFVVEWDGMSEEGQAEMIEFWSKKEVGRRAFADKTGFFAAEYDNVRHESSQEGSRHLVAIHCFSETINCRANIR